MNDVWWMMNYEWWMMNDEWWMMNGEWRMSVMINVCLSKIVNFLPSELPKELNGSLSKQIFSYGRENIKFLKMHWVSASVYRQKYSLQFG